MSRFEIGEAADAAQELESLLTFNGFDFRRDGERFRLVFSDRGLKWETICSCMDQTVLIYSYYPFTISDRKRASALCEAVNRQALFGSMLMLEERVAFRTGADLFDAYSAYEHIARALEYNASVMVRFWNQLAECAGYESGDSDGSSVS